MEPAAVAGVPVKVNRLPAGEAVTQTAPTTSTGSPSSDDAVNSKFSDPDGRQTSLASTSTSTFHALNASGSRPAPSQPQAPAQKKERERATVPSACVQCRSKHLKCDGLQPCARCASNSFECEYVKSRRGFKGPRRHGIQSRAPALSANTAMVEMSCPLGRPHGPPRVPPHVPSGRATPPDHRLRALPRPVDLPRCDIGYEAAASDPRAAPSKWDLRERCIEAFYYHFYPAHPFALPRANYYSLRREKPVEHLEAAMRYVGSFYVAQAPTVALGREAERSVYQADCPRDGFRVQAMLILAIGLDGNTEQEKALQTLLDAQDSALEMDMNKREFAIMNGGGSAVLEESWRRTWWELYVTDGMIAGVHQKSHFRMKDVLADVLLPCEEREYISGHMPHPHSIHDFDDESFDGRDFAYSSYTYRIAAMRNLGRVLQSRQVLPSDEATMDRVDAHLVNWRLHLPGSKKKLIDAAGQLDEMLFQAHMITAATTILLHREASELDSSVARNVTSCAPHKAVTPGPSYNVHAAKTIQAAQDISKLIQLPVPLVQHSHFFTCVVTLASIVHLSCWSVLMPLMRDEDLKQQLRLNTGALKTLWQVWPAAGQAFAQVKRVAQEIYAGKKQAAEIGYWANLTDDEVMRSMIEDRDIMEDLQLLN
ncbi:c6 zinc finger domain containing protein [Diplocarpon rosae]|nr:c6 zinc finger domain containing protein [Diplocarpon rosae]